MTLLDWLAGDGTRLLIVLEHREALELQRDHPEIAKRIMTWAAYWSRRPVYTAEGTIITQVAIKDADRVLERLCFHPLGPFTVWRDAGCG